MFESNNAGVMASPFMLSQDNIELQFATNHLGTLLISFSLICFKAATISCMGGSVDSDEGFSYRFPIFIYCYGKLE